MKFATRTVLGLMLGLAAQIVPVAASANAYPDRPIRLIVPFPPGGATDVVSRQLARSMSENLGTTIVIDNRGGAGAIIGAEAVAKSKPDGYTILATTAGVHVVNPAIYPQLPYDPVKSFVPIGLSISAPLAIAVPASSPFTTLRQFLDFAKANPNKLNYGSAGVGSSLHQTGEMLKHAAGVDILHVPYKGAGPAQNDFLAGNLSMMTGYVGSLSPHVQSGKARFLAIGSPKRLPVIKDIPTVGEVVGQPDFDADTWTGFAAPAGTPAPIIDRLNKALAFALQQNRDKLESQGYVVLGGTPDQMATRIRRELDTLTPVLAKIMKE